MTKLIVPPCSTKIWNPEENLPKVGKQDTTFIQQVTGTFLFYSNAVDPTTLVTISAITSEQSDPIEKTMKKLDYAASQDDTILIYQKPEVNSAVSEPKAQSKVGDIIIHQITQISPKHWIKIEYCNNHLSSDVISSRDSAGGYVHKYYFQSDKHWSG